MSQDEISPEESAENAKKVVERSKEYVDMSKSVDQLYDEMDEEHRHLLYKNIAVILKDKPEEIELAHEKVVKQSMVTLTAMSATMATREPEGILIEAVRQTSVVEGDESKVNAVGEIGPEDFEDEETYQAFVDWVEDRGL